MKKKKIKYKIDATLIEVAFWYLQKKRIPTTAENLIFVMHKILNIIDMKNKNTKQKMISFKNNQCEYFYDK